MMAFFDDTETSMGAGWGEYQITEFTHTVLKPPPIAIVPPSQLPALISAPSFYPTLPAG